MEQSEPIQKDDTPYDLKILRLGDCINFPEVGETVGIHYILRDEFESILESSYEWQKIFEWRIGSPSIASEIDQAIRKVSLGGKATVTIYPKHDSGSNNQKFLVYEIELMFIK